MALAAEPAFTDELPHNGPLHPNSPLGDTPETDVYDPESEEYIDGFSWRTVIGALFIGFIMMPGAIYLGLIAGQGIGPAAEWVTIILFMEVARRSYQTLKKQELYLLYYIGASLTQSVGGMALAGGAFAGLIWQQYNVHTPVAQALGITQHVPTWVVPHINSPALLQRTFMNHDWIPAITLLMLGQILSRMNTWGLGYVMFRITSDVEKLPFPLAPIAAAGATALAESSGGKEGWRWRIFSIGAMMGVGWGIIYVMVPAVTGLIFAQPIVIITVPFIDFTPNTQKILPAALSALGTDLGNVLVGFVLPLPIVVGTFITSVGLNIFGNPILYHFGILHTWTPGIDVIQTQVINNLDFYISFGIGISAVVAIIGIGSVIAAFARKDKSRIPGGPSRFAPPPGRGDWPMSWALISYIVATIGYIVICHVLVPGFPIWIMVFFGFIWTPLFSYINARMAGLAGSAITIPYVKEASVMMSGYRGVDIWFAPIPLGDFSGMAQTFRTVELTRTKFTSILKAELLMLPIMLVCSFLFWSFIWKLSPIPAAVYPYAAKFWPINAQMSALWMTANRDPAHNVLLKVIHIPYIGMGAFLASAAYAIIVSAKLPILLFYGLVNGTYSAPYAAIPMFAGGMLGRYYFSKRYGVENWAAYSPVLVAGYYCGMGLVGMGAVSLALLAKSVSRLPF